MHLTSSRKQTSIGLTADGRSSLKTSTPWFYSRMASAMSSYQRADLTKSCVISGEECQMGRTTWPHPQKCCKIYSIRQAVESIGSTSLPKVSFDGIREAPRCSMHAGMQLAVIVHACSSSSQNQQSGVFSPQLLWLSREL
jgi:hypothetical protein